MLVPSNIAEKVTREVWGSTLAELSYWKRKLIRTLRILWVVIRDLTEGQLTLQAMSLVYTTLLSLVPLLAVSFSVLKGFGVHNQLEPVLLQALAPLGEKSIEITQNIIGFVENMKVGVLGAMGLGLLVYTVVSLIQKIEHAFNCAWRVRQTRPLAQRFSDYLSVIVIGPVLVFSAMGVTASVMSLDIVQRAMAVSGLGALINGLARLTPYLLIIAAFAFIYVFVPNTKVRLRSALVGALVAGVLWQTVGWVFASFVVDSVKYSAIYSGLAVLIMFMIWLYLGWLIMLVGATISFYHQHPEYVATPRRDFHLSNRLKERLALALMYIIGQAHLKGRENWSSMALAQHVSVPVDAVESVLEPLTKNGMLVRTESEPPCLVPAKALDTISIRALLQAVRTAEEDPYLNLAGVISSHPVELVAKELEDGLDRVLGNRTLRDLVDTNQSD